jgi:hypothetical protein
MTVYPVAKAREFAFLPQDYYNLTADEAACNLNWPASRSDRFNLGKTSGIDFIRRWAQCWLYVWV